MTDTHTSQAFVSVFTRISDRGQPRPAVSRQAAGTEAEMVWVAAARGDGRPSEESIPGRKYCHSPKGKASGWIKERKGNTQRKQASVSYFYCWDEPVNRDGQAEYQRHQVYVPVSAIARVQEMIAERQPVGVLLDAIARFKQLARSRHAVLVQVAQGALVLDILTSTDAKCSYDHS